MTGHSFPRISVVTPSLDQAAFLEDTIASVLGQEYSDLEYFVLDGGSTDGSAKIIERHASKLDFWRSAPDAGQAAAINEGFARATGDVLCWVNSDDYFLPGALSRVQKVISGRTEQPLVVYGGAFVFNDDGSWGTYDAPTPFDRDLLRRRDFILQPSAFWTRAAWERVGKLDESLHYVFDWEWFLRASSVGVEFETIPGCLSGYRIHPGHKSGAQQENRRAELLQVLRDHAPREVVEHYEYLVGRPECWNPLRRWGDVADALARNGLPFPDRLASVLTRGTWAIPARLDRRLLHDGVFFL